MAYLLIRSQVLIQGFATDSEFTCQLGLLFASLDTLAQFGNTLRRQGFLPATVSTALLGKRNTLALTLATGSLTHGRPRIIASNLEQHQDPYHRRAPVLPLGHFRALPLEEGRRRGAPTSRGGRGAACDTTT